MSGAEGSSIPVPRNPRPDRSAAAPDRTNPLD
jgi:hypothetical protein